jgi:hypothetical protein
VVHGDIVYLKEWVRLLHIRRMDEVFFGRKERRRQSTYTHVKCKNDGWHSPVKVSTIRKQPKSACPWQENEITRLHEDKTYPGIIQDPFRELGAKRMPYTKISHMMNEECILIIKTITIHYRCLDFFLKKSDTETYVTIIKHRCLCFTNSDFCTILICIHNKHSTKKHEHPHYFTSLFCMLRNECCMKHTPSVSNYLSFWLFLDT